MKHSKRKRDMCLSQEGNFIFTTEGHPLPVTQALQRHRTPPHQHQPPGNATLATVHGHPFYAGHSALPPSLEPLAWTHDLVLHARRSRAEAAGAIETGPSNLPPLPSLFSPL